MNSVFHAALGEGRPALDERPEDKVINAMRLGRTVLGIVAAIWIVVAYPLSDGREEFVLGKLAELALSCAVLMAGTLLQRDRRRSRHQLVGRSAAVQCDVHQEGVSPPSAGGRGHSP
ncbi:hypothetical protein [Streptomyces sp. Isolate_45]|uniref:hypothetical protein n=1 Tax=Streptomyces sp. Isolate_45 TaxID=2950111 RepID=UPI002481D349|nr:hypothetical protein [Streptomyces sp. Isolate_45]MDA5279976.1 hypothetical protein [Streptomyces sp. Isolate_45]